MGKWTRHPESYTREEKKHILSKVVEIMIRVTFSTHFYKWENKIYKQCKGGPIGLRASGVIAKIIMEIWIRLMREKIERAGLKVHLIKKYVDDVLIVCSKVKPGMRLNENGVLERSFETFGADIREKKCQDQATLEILQKLANDVFPFLE